MKAFKYGDEMIGEKELMIVVASMVIGGDILNLPANLAEVAIGSDGWMIITITGLVFVFFSWMTAKLAARFPHQIFYTYASLIITKPVAIILTCLYGIIFLLISSYVVRNIAGTASDYLLSQTPVEIITLVFLLVIVYAVSGSRVGVLRLNMIFLPIIIFVVIMILIFNLQIFNINHLLPVFKTSSSGYVEGIKRASGSYIGYGVILFYIAYVRKPERAPRAVAMGMCIPIVFYVMVFLTTIVVFGQEGTANLLNPLIELAKQAEVPGMILERIESIFFTVWMMTIFTTAAMAFDVAVFAFHSVFKKMKKMKVIFILAPIQYYISMLPEDITALQRFGEAISYILMSFIIFVTFLLLLIAKIRGVKGSE